MKPDPIEKAIKHIVNLLSRSGVTIDSETREAWIQLVHTTIYENGDEIRAIERMEVT